ncbi:DUF4082 domain-containing protein [Acidicapsa ligni]|uniref:DUF4082 domain-containing protein n=1 Tax=Acidicapsa ligni TaxID=542300 RepID=UPI0021DF6428|nr:DUF4082 domain-containing protein [Acidicapsa ligni]
MRIIGLIVIALIGFSAHAFSQCSNAANPIVAENCLPGNDSDEWDVSTSDAGDLTIQGFATDISVNQGGTINFKIDTPASAYTINIYRMGYYAGNGARKIATITPSVKLPQTQPACLSDATTGLTDCGNWAVSASWQVPATATSGIYFAHLIRTDTGGDSHIVFIVRNDSSKSNILYQTSDTTWQAYNYYGNGSLYGPGYNSFNLPLRTYKVSYNRPVLTRGFQAESATWVFGAEFAMVQWLEANGYDVSYSTALDAARNGSLILNHKVYMDSGHDEYVSGPARTNIQAARDAGVNLAFFSGNEFFWKTRWENSIDGTNTAYRTLACYKETLAFAKLDPEDPPTWTGTWRDPTFSPPADGGLPENALTGTLFMVNGPNVDNSGNLSILVPQADGQMRFWRNTAVASLAAGKTYTLVPGSLGYEWDVDADNGARPPGAFHLSTSAYALTTDLLLDYGGTYGAGTATHHMMMYRAPSGALVFGAGTVDWAYGLNNNHDNPFASQNPNPDINMEQATVNLFADMGVQPATIQPGLSAASPSTDTTAPHSTITGPNAGATIDTGSTVTVTGTASDVGGVVAGVEFSGDGGQTWHPATGRTSWSYAWTPTVAGSNTLLSRAVDDSGNLETPSPGLVLGVSPQVCPCTIFGSNIPSNLDSADPYAVEVGVKFRADADGSILGVRFYKATTNTGTHIGHIWTDSGQLLGTATFTNETASGWQQVNFTTPIAATANTVYVASYFSPVGHYSADSFYFQQSGADDPPLHGLQNGVDGGNGMYFYGATGGFPTATYNSTNYWVDVIFSSSNTYSISGNIGGIGGPGATVVLSGPENLTLSADSSGNYNFDGVVNGSYSVSVSNPGVSFSPSSQTVNVSFGAVTGVNFVATVANPLTISGSISGGAGATVNLAGATTETATADGSGNYSFPGLLSGSYTVTPDEAGYIFMPSTQSVNLSGGSAAGVNFTGQICNCISIWPSSVTPATIDSGDVFSTEVGVLFTADSPAYLTGIRFYKASTNLGTHVGHLWSNTGVLLGTATFPSETASGWQQGYFASPVWVNASTTYIASYLAPNGHYSATNGYFASSGTDSPPLHALADGVSGHDGIYIYSSTAAFPTNSYQSTNYWVDVLYAAETYSISGTITGAGGPGATVALGGTIPATTTADANGNFTFNGVYSGTYSITPTNAGAIFLPGNQNVTVAQSNITGVNFTVPQVCPCNTIWQPSSKPVVADSSDPESVEVGVKLQSDSDGYILGLRFYKAATNTGVHIGNLWSGSGATSPLSTATFVNESASGWQQVMFANPVPVVANTPYVASYFSPVGHYAADAAYFATTGTNSPPLHALENGVDGGNGVFTYSATSTLPTGSYNANNYWVDVIYAATGTYTIAGTISGTGAAGTTVTLSGAANATTIADSNGNYSFTNIANGSYTVTASQSGIVFSPASQTVTINGAHNLAITFTASVLGYAVSGTVGGAPGITVTLAGATTQTTIADASGNYSFATVPNGTYTVTPSGPAFNVSPLNQSVTVNGSAVSGVNFTSAAVLYSVSGTISGGAGSTVSLIGTSTSTTTADSMGNYSFTGVTVGTYTILPSISAGVVFSPGSQTVVLNGANAVNVNFTVPQNCPCDTIWPSAPTPATTDSNDNSSVEVGVKFTASADAYISGLRFYKALANTGTHIGHIWSASGTLLGSATFTNESNSGWQQVFFSTPIPVAANTTYVASYFAPAGNYSADVAYFSTSGVSTPPLQALANGVNGPNGVYVYATTGSFPNVDSLNNAINYWVDVIYTPSSTYSITGTLGGAGGPGASVTLTGTSTATTTADASGNFAFSGLANGTYAVTPSVSGYSFSPATQSATINNSHVLGLNFTSNTAAFTISGSISGAGGNGATVSLSGAATATTTANASGAFSFTGLANGSYIVTANKIGYIITPNSQSVIVNGTNATTAFSSVAQTYSITGTISGAGGNGATVSLSGAATSSTTANASGVYTFSGVTSGSYTVTPAKTGFAFTPPSQAVTISTASGTANFTSVATHSITGTISGAGGNGATVSLSGAATASTTANASGVYTFAGVVAGAYTVTPSKAGYVFTPASTAVTVSTANVTANFTSAVQTFTITGTISGTGGNGATVALSGTKSATTTANSAGTYSFTGLAVGSYTVTVTKTGFAFTPPNQAVTISTANGTANFTSAATHTITGTISGAGGNGATVSLGGAATASTTANILGSYTFTGVVAGAYTVTPSKAGYVFTPASTAVTVSTANVTANFTSAVQTFTITGTVSGTGGNGATVALSGTKSATTTANSAGTYSFTGLAVGSYTVTVTKTGFAFTPPNQAVTISTANGTANFTSVATHTISGTISGTGGNGATVSLSGAATASTTANTSGVYTFSGVAPGSYTVTPSKTNFIFTPTSTAVTVSTANVTANFTSAATHSITGTISGAGGNGATVSLSGAATASVTANASGVYTFTGVAAGSYTVTPSKASFTFTPTSTAVTVSTANVTVNFSTAGTPIVPFIQVNGAAWQQVSSVTVAPGSTVNLGPQPSTGGSWSWSGPNRFTSTSREIDGIRLTTGTNTYVATYTNTSGTKSTQTFTITVT